MKRFVNVLATAVGRRPAGALIAAVMVLPSRLILWDRWHRVRGEEPVDRARVEEILDGRGNVPAELDESPIAQESRVSD